MVPESISHVLNTEIIEVVDRIIACRRAFLGRARDAEQTRHQRLEKSRQSEQVNYERQKIRYGKRSGHPKLQAAASRLKTIRGNLNYSNGRLASIGNVIEGLNVEREQLLVVIACYATSTAIQFTPYCYNVRIEENGRLNIYFSPYDDLSQKGVRHGHVSITPELSVYYERLAGESRGYHNFSTSRNK